MLAFRDGIEGLLSLFVIIQPQTAITIFQVIFQRNVQNRMFNTMLIIASGIRIIAYLIKTMGASKV